MAKRVIFRMTTPLGYAVVLTRNRWREIVRFKHPAVAQRLAEVRQCLQAPDVIRASSKDADVHLYYRTCKEQHLCVVTGGDVADKDRIVVTAYLTKRVKQGNELWRK